MHSNASKLTAHCSAACMAQRCTCSLVIFPLAQSCFKSSPVWAHRCGHFHWKPQLQLCFLPNGVVRGPLFSHFGSLQLGSAQLPGQLRAPLRYDDRIPCPVVVGGIAAGSWFGLSSDKPAHHVFFVELLFCSWYLPSLVEYFCTVIAANVPLVSARYPR